MQKVHEHVFEVEFVSSPQLVQSIRPRWDVGHGLHNADVLPHELHGLHYVDALPHDQLSRFENTRSTGCCPSLLCLKVDLRLLTASVLSR